MSDLVRIFAVVAVSAICIIVASSSERAIFSPAASPADASRGPATPGAWDGMRARAEAAAKAILLMDANAAARETIPADLGVPYHASALRALTFPKEVARVCLCETGGRYSRSGNHHCVQLDARGRIPITTHGGMLAVPGSARVPPCRYCGPVLLASDDTRTCFLNNGDIVC